jgi:hypothetical protein
MDCFARHVVAMDDLAVEVHRFMGVAALASATHAG